ncbi:MAG: class I SAM-dependent methyltransferase [Chloroflexota bacterium]|nr:class I SAM-dependent methyltransferase [Chloroflexota bacterium]
MLTVDEIKQLYDRLGARQDRSAYYEDRAIADLAGSAQFARAQRVFEFGCGTGRVAAHLLAAQLPASARYYAVDLSSTMVQLAAARLSVWIDRTLLARTAEAPHLPLLDASVDRFVSLYVLDILSEDAIGWLLSESRRVLTTDGRLCVISLTHGATPLARLWSRGWQWVYLRRPHLVGGCRPLRLHTLLSEEWQVVHHAVVTVRGMSSEVLVATPR